MAAGVYGCAGAGAQLQQQAAERASNPADLEQPATAEVPLELTAPTELLSYLQLPVRAASYLPEDLLKEAEAFDTALPNRNVIADADGAIFSPSLSKEQDSATGLSFAMYNFSVPEYGGNSDLFFNWRSAPVLPTRAYAGLADWASDRWDFFALSATGELNLPTMAPYFDPAGRLLVVVLLTGTTSAQLDWLRLGSLPPLVQYTLTPQLALVPVSAILDASGSTDPDGSVAEYLWDPEGDGTFISSGLVAQLEHDYETAGVYAATVRVVDNTGVYAQRSLTIEALDQLALHYGAEAFFEHITSLIVLEDGDLMLFGNSSNETTEQARIAVARINFDATAEFAYCWGGDSAECTDAARGPDGNIYACGQTADHGVGGTDALLQKWTPEGELLWTRCYGRVDASESLRALIVTGDALYLCGYETLHANGTSLGLMMSTDFDGNLLWASSIVSPRTCILEDLQYRSSPFADPYLGLAGSFYHNDSNEDALYASYDVNGNLLGASTWGQSDRPEAANSISITGAVVTNTFIAGIVSNSFGFLGTVGGTVFELNDEWSSGAKALNLMGHALVFRSGTFDPESQSHLSATGVAGFDDSLEFAPAQMTGFTGNSYLSEIAHYSENYYVLGGTVYGTLELGQQTTLSTAPSAQSWQGFTPSQGEPQLTTTDIGAAPVVADNMVFLDSGVFDFSMLIAPL